MIDVVHKMLWSSKISQSQAKLRAAGDIARDRRAWAEAESFYRDYLDQVTDDAAIWVQLGHALKEQSRVNEAKLAYDKAVELAPTDADAHLQLAHALKVLGLQGEAVAAYEEALRLGDTEGAFQELVALGYGAEARQIAQDSDTRAESAMFLEITDLLIYLKAHPTLSGIQRVQASIARHAHMESRDAERYRFVIGSGTDLLAVPHAKLLRVVDYVTGSSVKHERLKELIAEAERAAVPTELHAGDSYVILGCFWVAREDVMRRCARLKAAGVRIGVYVYDLIPISHPEFCDVALSRDFTAAIGDIFPFFDFAVTISEFTAREVRGFLARHGLRDMPVEAVTLAHSMSDGKPLPGGWTAAIAPLKGRRYVLCVSTIEARKNHAFLFHLWKRLAQEQQNENDTPDLVFVGRHGWRVSDLFAQIEDTRYLDGHLHILHDLTDRELATLYENALFTAFPSFVEGWGLPVGESLTHGRICIASNNSSIPEVGGTFVDYIDPHNMTAAEQVFRRMINDKNYRAEREALIREKFQPRLWVDVAKDFFTTVERLIDTVAPEPRIIALLLPRSAVFRPALLSNLLFLTADYPRYPWRAILADGWYSCEDFGVWMQGEWGRLLFRADVEEGEEVTIFLKLLPAPHVNANSVTASVLHDQSVRFDSLKPNKVEVSLKPGRPMALRLYGRAGAGGIVEVLLRLSKPATALGTDVRRFALGLTQLGYAPTGDLTARQDLLEAILLSGD